MTIKQKEHERRMGFARQKAAQAWCGETTKGKTMDVELAEEFARILVIPMFEPKLGCATTRDLIEEVEARIEMDGKLDYMPIDDK